MNSDCTNAMKLNDDSVASINVCGSYIYYVKKISSRKPSEQYSGDSYSVFTAVT